MPDKESQKINFLEQVFHFTCYYKTLAIVNILTVVRYSSRYAVTFDNGIAFALNIIVFWRQIVYLVADSYLKRR